MLDGGTFLTATNLLWKFERVSLEEAAQDTGHCVNLFGVNLRLHKCQGNHRARLSSKTAKNVTLVWYTCSSFGLTPFGSNFTDCVNVGYLSMTSLKLIQ